MPSLNITDLIDDRPVSRFQTRVFLLCGLVVFLDGVDYQIIGIAAPFVVKEFGIAKSMLGWIFSAATLGAAIGGLTCGPIADRVGRQRTLIASTLAFGLATLATPLAHDVPALVALRFVTGLGLGGAVPCLVALASEYAPRRRRATIIGLLWAAFPMGGMTGGFVNAWVIQSAEWRDIFYIWGAAPVVVAGVLAMGLPESLRFMLARRHVDPNGARRIAERIASTKIDPATVLVVSDERLTGLPLKRLLTNGRAPMTLALWLSLLVILGALTVVAAWSPALLTPLGISPSDAARLVGVNGLGSLVGTGIAGRMMERFGVLLCVIPSVLLAAIAVAAFGEAGSGALGGLMLASLLTGFFLGICSSSGIALSALVYPTAIRSTGIGWALGIGRLGSVIGPLAVAAMVASGASVPQVFLAVAAGLMVAVPCMWVLDGHDRRHRHASGRGPTMPSMSDGGNGSTHDRRLQETPNYNQKGRSNVYL